MTWVRTNFGWVDVDKWLVECRDCGEKITEKDHQCQRADEPVEMRADENRGGGVSESPYDWTVDEVLAAWNAFVAAPEDATKGELRAVMDAARASVPSPEPGVGR